MLRKSLLASNSVLEYHRAAGLENRPLEHILQPGEDHWSLSFIYFNKNLTSYNTIGGKKKKIVLFVGF